MGISLKPYSAPKETTENPELEAIRELLPDDELQKLIEQQGGVPEGPEQIAALAAEIRDQMGQRVLAEVEQNRRSVQKSRAVLAAEVLGLTALGFFAIDGVDSLGRGFLAHQSEQRTAQYEKGKLEAVAQSGSLKELDERIKNKEFEIMHQHRAEYERSENRLTDSPYQDAKVEALTQAGSWQEATARLIDLYDSADTMLEQYSILLAMKVVLEAQAEAGDLRADGETFDEKEMRPVGKSGVMAAFPPNMPSVAKPQ